MAPKKIRENGGKAPFAGVQKEMAKPRMAKSAKLAELDLQNLGSDRIPRLPSIMLSGTVRKHPRP
jgi:hypothetical protein